MFARASSQAMCPSGYAAAPTQNPSSARRMTRSFAKRNGPSASDASAVRSPRSARTLAMPLRFRSSMAREMDSSVAPRQVRCATVGMSKSSWIMAATSAVACRLPLPPAEYVTLTKSGSRSASSAATSCAVSSVRSPFGGNISNETGWRPAARAAAYMSETLLMGVIIRKRPGRAGRGAIGGAGPEPSQASAKKGAGAPARPRTNALAPEARLPPHGGAQLAQRHEREHRSRDDENEHEGGHEPRRLGHVDAHADEGPQEH